MDEQSKCPRTLKIDENPQKDIVNELEVANGFDVPIVSEVLDTKEDNTEEIDEVNDVKNDAEPLKNVML